MVSAATETSCWKRPDSVAQKVGQELAALVSEPLCKLPQDTEEICVREGDHISPNDMRDHITAVAYTSKNQQITVHILTKPEPSA